VRGRLLLFFDYDTQWGADRSRSGGGVKAWGAHEFPSTERILDLLDTHSLSATFAVVGEAALPGDRPYHDPVQVRRIHRRGHEVASHAHRHEWLPALSRQALRATLSDSKRALEDCIGAPVVTFVPPFNQPFDYARGLSFSLSERREARGERVDLAALCEALAETGYLFCRVAYRPLKQRLGEKLRGRRLDRPSRLETIKGVSCIRLNTPGGFDAPALEMLEKASAHGGVAVVYSHPHSLHAGNSQDERFLVPFLERAARLRDEGALEIVLPRTLVRVARPAEERTAEPAELEAVR
jgi:peptidoglycan/xylan/chitin deacetylase (PgdA/CDA1 family)